VTEARPRVTCVFIVEDHPAVRKMLRQFIRRTEGLALCAEADSAEAALEQIPASGAQLVLVDVSLPGMDGIELIRILHERYPHLLSLVLSGHDESVYAVPALRAGARGYVMKGEILNLVEAIRHVCNGGIYASHAVRAKLNRLG
jgi:DNA-binding NarL/FixJ family response regulator